MTFNPQIGAVGISIQWHFKCHLLELTFISTVSFQTPLGIGMHSLQLYSPLLKVLRTLSLDSHHLWDLETSPCNRWPWWMNVYWCITSKIFWFWERERERERDLFYILTRKTCTKNSFGLFRHFLYKNKYHFIYYWLCINVSMVSLWQ